MTKHKLYLLSLSLVLLCFSLIVSPVSAYYTNMPASVVIGQPDFTSGSVNQGGSTGQNTLNAPLGSFSDGTRLFVADFSNSRVLIWNSIPTRNKQPADIVVGQPDFVTTSAGTTISKFFLPVSVTIYNNKLIIGDGGGATSGQRVLIFNSIPTTNGASADVVVGQDDFTSKASGATANRFVNVTRGVVVFNNKLIVPDFTGNRVLIFDPLPTTNGASASVVIGQPDFVSSTADNGGVSCATLNSPDGVNVTPTGRLTIGDTGRVLIFNQIPTSNFQSADIVFGRPDCSTRTSSGEINAKLFSNSGNTRMGTDKTNSRLLVSDASNNRVLIFDNTITTPQISLTTPPTSIGTGRYRLLGNINMNNNGGTYSLQTLQADLNGTGYGNISIPGGRSDGSGNTIYDFIYDFDPSVGGGDINTNLTLKFLASTFNADTNTLFYFLPFKLKSVTTKQIIFNVNKLQLTKIKDNISHFEVWSKSSTSTLWTKYIDNILPSQIDTNGDVYISKINSLTSTSYKVKAVDNWNNSQESNVLSFSSTSVPVTNFVSLTGSPTFSPEPSNTEAPLHSPETLIIPESNQSQSEPEPKANNYFKFILPIGIALLLLFGLIAILKRKK